MDGQPEALIDLDAITANAAALRRHVGAAQVMAVVKSDAYGHGMVPAARAALAGGATWLGVVQLDDAIALRQAGVDARVLSLHGSPDASHAEAIGHDVDMTAGTVSLVQQIAAAAAVAGLARLHLEADTGMGRGGAIARDWPAVVDAARAAEAEGLVRVVGLWSHFACADIPGHPSIEQQLAAFRAAVEVAERAGCQPEVRHLANTPATLTLPESYFDLVRPGGAVVGLSTPARRGPGLAAPGHDRQRPPDPGQAGTGRERPSRTRTATSPAASPRSGSCLSATTRASRGTRRTWPTCCSPAAAGSRSRAPSA